MRTVVYTIAALLTAAGTSIGSAIPDSSIAARGEANNDVNTLAKRGIAVDVCKALNGNDCINLDLGPGTCNNLYSSDGRPFISGTVGGDICTFYSEPGCPVFSGENKGISGVTANFGWNAQSVECVWR